MSLRQLLDEDAAGAVHGGAATIFDLLPDGSDSVFAAGCDWLELCVVVHGGTMTTFTFALLGSTTWFCACEPLELDDCCAPTDCAPAPPGVTRMVLLGGGETLPLPPELEPAAWPPCWHATDRTAWPWRTSSTRATCAAR